MLTPVSRDLIFFGKMLGSSLFMLLVEVAVFLSSQFSTTSRFYCPG